MFATYYGDDNWADKWVMAALDSTPTAFTSGRGNADFSTMNDAATRDQAVKKGVVYMNDFQCVPRRDEPEIRPRYARDMPEIGAGHLRSSR